MHRLADRALVDVDGHPVDGRVLLARGRATYVKLYSQAPGTDPANRILATPETARQLRAALLDPTHPNADALRDGYALPPIDDLASSNRGATLEWRRRILNQVERDFVVGLADSDLDLDDLVKQAQATRIQRLDAAVRALGASPSSEALVGWFLKFYEDPANGVPYDGKEGGYHYTFGGPFEAEDVLIEAFPDMEPSELAKALEEIHELGYIWVESGVY